MRFFLAAAIFVTAMAFDLRPAPARGVHRAAPWCVIVNTGRAVGTFRAKKPCARNWRTNSATSGTPFSPSAMPKRG